MKTQHENALKRAKDQLKKTELELKMKKELCDNLNF
jgi:hypothetical protein